VATHPLRREHARLASPGMQGELDLGNVTRRRPQTCQYSVDWWNVCELPAGHDGPHRDGLTQFDDDGSEVITDGSSAPGSSARRAGP
jgi:hypothetical protein